MMEKQLDSHYEALKTQMAIQKTVTDLERQRKTCNSVNLSLLPDKGAKLKQSIFNLEETLNKLTIQLKKCSISKETDKKCNTDKKCKENVSSNIFVETKVGEYKESINMLNANQAMNVVATSNDSGYNENTESSKQFIFNSPSKEITSFHELSKKTEKNNHTVLNEFADSPSFKNYRESKPISSIKVIEAKPLYDVNIQKKHLQNVFTSTYLNPVVNEETVIKLQNSLLVYPEDAEDETQPNKLKSSLMPHQIKALSWLIWREAQLPSGGILADDMGLGKTLTMIALILKQKEKETFADVSNEKSISNVTKGTLIVCLASILHQWANEITKHSNKDSLRVLLYHGPKREKKIDNMKSFDVVLTTYDILVSEKKLLLTKDQKSGLFELKWERVILDEAHTIKNSSTKKAEAVFCLKSFKKWCVTGTPIHNDFKDMYSLIKFLQFYPFDDNEKFKKLTNNDERRNLLVKSILLRRTKTDMDESGRPLIEMKNKSVIICNIELSPEEREIYNELHTKVCNIVNKFFHEPRNCFQSSSSLLVLLLRLQQCCSHTSLLQEEAEEIVHDSLSDVSMCLSSLTLDDQSNCSSGSDSKLNLTFSEYEKINISDSSVKSTKIQKLFDELNRISSESNNSSKSVIVSQWVSMLKLVAFHLKQEGKSYHMIIGSTKPENRQKVVEDFNSNSEGRKIMLLSLKAGGVGLNLVGANHLFLLDLHWNPALEIQACDRIHRVGQKNDVIIHKFVCKDTIEENILERQKKKSDIACDVFHGAGKAKTGLSMEDFKLLFNVRL